VAAAPPSMGSPAAAAAGNFFVQISVQRSEEDAQTAFRAMKAKYPDQLGGRQVVIRRKGFEKRVFYGVQVGPFASHDDAVQLCESLKSAGGAGIFRSIEARPKAGLSAGSRRQGLDQSRQKS